MHAWRWIARNQEESQWQLIPRQNTGRMYQLGELHGIRGLPPSRHVELLPYALGKASSGPSVPGDGTDGSGSLGLDAKLGLTTQLHARRDREPGLRPGGGRSVGREPDRLRDLLRGEAAVLPRGAQDLRLRDRGRRPALLLAPHRPGAVLRAAVAAGRDAAHAREHDDPRRREDHGQDERRALGGRAAELHAEGDGRGHVGARLARAGRGSPSAATPWRACRRTGTRATPSSAAWSPRPTASSTTPPRDASDPGVERRARLHALLRRPRVAAARRARS